MLAQDTATTSFSVDILLAIEQTASEFGLNSFLINIFSEDDAARAARQLLAHRPDGIIYTTMGLRHITLPESLYGENIVLANCVAVWMTQRYPVISLMITLHNMNQHSICSRRAIVNRYASGYRKVRWQQGIVGRDLSRPGVMLDEILQVKQFHMATGDDHYTDLASLLNDHFKSGKPDFDVLICGNDRAAFVAYQVLLAKGVRIPQDVAVMGLIIWLASGICFYCR